MAGENPYAPPEARLADAPAGPGSAIKAVALGVATDLGGTVAFGILMGIVLLGAGVDPEAMDAMATSPDSWVFWVGGAFGLGFSVLGGYVCARVARRGEMRLGAIVAAVSAVAGFTLAGEGMQLGTLLAMTLLSIGAVLYGAHWGAMRNRSA